MSSDSEQFSQRFRNWKNQYIDLVEKNSNYIMSIYGSKPSVEVIAEFKRRLDGFASLVCEIGSGSGGHLIDRAKADPKALHVGFELRFKRAFKTAQKAERVGLSNVLVLRADARLLPHLFDPQSLAGTYINFPDPWEKKRWRKNRILNQGFVDTLHQLLKVGGFISYKTDHIEYFRETAASIYAHGGFQTAKITENFHQSAYLEGNVSSEFENLFRSQGLPVAFLEARKIGGLPTPGV